MYVQKELFQVIPGLSDFMFTAHIRNIRGGEGYAGMKIRLNRPPTEGVCTAGSMNLTLGEVVKVHCVGWWDYDGIVNYKYFGKDHRDRSNHDCCAVRLYQRLTPSHLARL